VPSVRFYVDTALTDLRDRLNEFLGQVDPDQIINISLTTTKNQGERTEYIATVVLKENIEAHTHIDH
jgi:hypothetical protein